MRSAPLFHLECAPVALADGFHYVVLSALQWNPPNLDLMATANKQRFAVLYQQPLEERFAMETLEQAHIHGALSEVKLVAVHKDTIHLFFGDEVAGITLPAIESLWELVKDLIPNRRLALDFSCEAEVYSGRSDYAFWPAVKEVLESNNLGIERYPAPALHDCAEEILNAENLEFHKAHRNILQYSAAQPVTSIGMCPMDLFLGSQAEHSRCLTAKSYNPDTQHFSGTGTQCFGLLIPL
ncbi:hypothetical protein [Pseudomonas monteilii]|uniref:hypothetical protein n=1 Tax=Pseudomonas monteilii TaxID=76759 RepID=UPI0018A8999D|nr:hypothetical protein [Pseudomonas monteilii]MBF8747662.1 hypothetical protein [Pseudomonas monteilii]